MQQEIEIKWPAEGNARVPYRMFSDPDIYRAELDRIFLGPTWQYLALGGELPQTGDYLTTFLGETPVIVTRGHDGEIHAMVNRCAHRGNLVCLKRRGHADNLTCVYHAWRYDLQGNLDSVAFRRGIAGKGGMPPSFRLEEHGLKKLRVDKFGDLVFGTLPPRRRHWRITSETRSARAFTGSCTASQRSSAPPRRFCTTTGSFISRMCGTPTTRPCCTPFLRPFASRG